ncbi:SusC/RagA family TonB-linked outer membrane protein [Labilibaculum euxinus]
MKKLLILFSLVIISITIMAQTKLTGVVYDSEKLPLIGASIRISGTSEGTVADMDGKFSFETDLTKGRLQISFIGFQSIEREFDGSQDYTIYLAQETTSLNDVVVIGYGSSRKSDLTGSVASVSNMDQISSRPITSAQEFLQGNLAGVTVQQQGGDPASTPTITIRGMGSVNTESPLWVVDGMPYYGGTLNPNDIESITVLKDAASAAIYGAQASSGVIVVTTKSGKAGKLSVAVDVFAGVQQADNLPVPLTAEEQNWAYNTAADNSGAVRDPARDVSLNPWGGVNRTNWIDEIFRKASVYNANVGLSGGGEKGIYSASFSYQKKQGLLINTSSERIGLRVKSQYNLSDKMRVGQNLYVLNEEAIGTNNTSSYSGTIINAMYMPSAAPVYDGEGNFHGVAPKGSDYAGSYGDVYNPVALLKRPATSNPVTYIDANAYIEFDFIKDFKFRSSLMLSLKDSEYKKFTPKIPESGRPSEMNYLNQSWSKRNKWIWDNQVSYSKTINNHHLDFTGVYSAQYTKYEYNLVNAQDFAREENWYHYLENAGSINSYSSDAYEDALNSMIGRFRYNYSDKYFLMGSIRRDQTSRLSSENNSDLFPSASVAWKMSNESFMQELNWIHSMKLRASWGQIGNIQSVSYYAYNVPMSSQRPTLGEGDAQKVSGYYVKQQSNPNLKWETSESFDVGLDLSLFKGSLEITSDYFVKNTNDMIMTNAADSHLGVNDGPTSNVGTVENKGFEFSALYKGNIGSLKYSVNGNFSTTKNNLKDLDGYTSSYIYHSNNVRSTLYPYRSEPGQELYSYYLISSDGIFKTQTEIDNYTGSNGQLIQPNAKPGDLKFIDSNKDGEISNEDRTYKGNAFPDFTYAFNFSAEYKNFDLALTFQGVSGVKLFNAYKFTSYNAAQQGYNLDNRVLNAWSESNINSEIPMLRVDDPNSNFGTNSDWYLEDGSYLRLKNLTIGYNVPALLLNRICQGSSLRVYFSAENLFTITDYTGLDPEVGGIGLDLGTYPVAKTYSLGLSFKF